MFSILNKPRNIKLLFRGSEHNFKAEAFHKNCDNIKNTLTVVRTEFGKTIAGFSHYKWNQVSDYKNVEDSNRRSFLLQLDSMEVLMPQKDCGLIQCFSGAGPAFGRYHDLYITDNCHQNRSSFANFP